MLNLGHPGPTHAAISEQKSLFVIGAPGSWMVCAIGDGAVSTGQSEGGEEALQVVEGARSTQRRAGDCIQAYNYR
jgi:hypothetical protein